MVPAGEDLEGVVAFMIEIWIVGRRLEFAVVHFLVRGKF